jgi:hypothetical protein
VKRLHQIVGLVLLVLWVPITAHCTLENVPGLEFLKCATDSDQGKDCKGDSCTQLESATYKISDTHTDFLPSAFTALFAFVMAEFPADEQPIAIIEAPPEISCSWQFSFRTALPPRAPSFVS